MKIYYAEIQKSFKEQEQHIFIFYFNSIIVIAKNRQWSSLNCWTAKLKKIHIIYWKYRSLFYVPIKMFIICMEIRRVKTWKKNYATHPLNYIRFATWNKEWSQKINYTYLLQDLCYFLVSREILTNFFAKDN